MKLYQLITLFTDNVYLNSEILIKQNSNEELFNVGDTTNDIPDTLDEVEIKNCRIENNTLIVELK